MTVQSSSASGAATPSICTPAVAGVLERGRCAVALAVHEVDQGCAGEVVAAGDARLLVGIAVRDQLAVGGDDERVALLADPNPIDHPPHFFEADLADERSRALSDAASA